MDKRVAKVLWSKSGAKSDITRITLPVSWIRDMGLTKEIREMDIEYDQEKKIITLRKKEGTIDWKGEKRFSLFFLEKMTL